VKKLLDLHQTKTKNNQRPILHIYRGIHFTSGNVSFLADRGNGRDYATVLRLSVVSRLSSVCNVMHCGKTVRRMNDLDLCLEVVLRSCEPHSPLNISETVREAWFQRTTNRKWPTGNQMARDR